VHLLRCLSLVLVSLCLSGCAGNWLVGEWELDRDRTLEEMGAAEAKESEAEDAGAGLLEGIVGGLQKGFSRVMLARFEGTEIHFTKTEIRRVRNGTGEAQTYRIIERPDPDTFLVKYADGDIATWNRVEDGVRLKLPGEADHWVYFQPAE